MHWIQEQKSVRHNFILPSVTLAPNTHLGLHVAGSLARFGFVLGFSFFSLQHLDLSNEHYLIFPSGIVVSSSENFWRLGPS